MANTLIKAGTKISASKMDLFKNELGHAIMKQNNPLTVKTSMITELKNNVEENVNSHLYRQLRTTLPPYNDKTLNLLTKINKIFKDTRKFSVLKDSKELGLSQLDEKLSYERGLVYQKKHGLLKNYFKEELPDPDPLLDGIRVADNYDTRFHSENPFLNYPELAIENTAASFSETRDEFMENLGKISKLSEQDFLDPNNEIAQKLLDNINSLKINPPTGAGEFNDEGIYDIIKSKNATSYSEFEKQTYQKYANIHPSEKIYRPLNRMLNGVRQLPADINIGFTEEQVNKLITELDTALHNGEKYNDIAYRYKVYSFNDEELNSFLNKHKVGNIVENYSYLSTTKNKKAHQDYRAIFELSRSKFNGQGIDFSDLSADPTRKAYFIQTQIIGKSGVDISGASQLPSEGEILFPRNNKYYISARRISEQNIISLIYQEIDPDEVL